ncbi:MAG: hypothetical protein EAZ24_17255 [Burkholderiales bacterium]|nr:MAG: hypothetical protein EAZ24_17255 [Burkholderiales bacterium]
MAIRAQRIDSNFFVRRLRMPDTSIAGGSVAELLKLPLYSVAAQTVVRCNLWQIEQKSCGFVVSVHAACIAKFCGAHCQVTNRGLPRSLRPGIRADDKSQKTLKL